MYIFSFFRSLFRHCCTISMEARRLKGTFAVNHVWAEQVMVSLDVRNGASKSKCGPSTCQGHEQEEQASIVASL